MPLWLLILVALVPVLLVAFVIAWISAWSRVLRLPERFDEVFTLPTPDGATVFLGRYHASRPASPLPPVVLCHGLAMNRMALAMDEKLGLAHLLASRGRDTWVLELRGASSGRDYHDWAGSTFDTYATLDLPTALEHVQRITGAKQVDWVGFSMGGLLAYAHLGALGARDIRRLVTIGSPVSLRENARWFGWTWHFANLISWIPRTPVKLLAAGVAPWVVPALPRSLTYGFRGEHYDARTLRGAMATTMGDVPAGVMAQFVRWMHEDRFASADGRTDYREGMKSIEVPALVIAGSADRVAAPAAVREGYALLASEEKDYLEVGPLSGAREPYDHLDLILGSDAPADVFEPAVAWLDRP